MARALVLYNPVSGRGRAHRLAEAASERLCAGGYRVELRATEPGRGATQLAREAGPGSQRIVVAGGDGSLREALAGLRAAGHDVPLTLLPGGNANVVARALGIPLDAAGALRLLEEGRPTRLDLGRIDGGELFLAMVGIGWDARTVHRVARLRRSRIGRLWYRVSADSAYALLGLVAAFERGPSLEITLDGIPLGESAAGAITCNLGSYGKGWTMAPDAGPATGALHLCAQRRPGAIAVARQVYAAARHRDAPAAVVRRERARRVHIRSDASFPVQVDGDERGTARVLRLEVLPAAARVVAPALLQTGPEPSSL